MLNDMPTGTESNYSGDDTQPDFIIHDMPECKTQKEYIAFLQRCHLLGKPLDLEMIVNCWDLDKGTNEIRAWLKQTGHKETDFDAEVRKVRVTKELGGYPRNPEHFVELFVKRDKITARFGGQIDQDIPPHTVIDGKRVIATPDDLKDKATEQSLRRRTARTTTASQICLDMRCIRSNNKLPFDTVSIEDAVTQWHRRAQKECFGVIADMISDKGSRFEKSNRDLLELVEKTFDCSDSSPEFVAAVLKKFMWQVKRKINGQNVSDHLMPVIVGKQGCGKTTFITKLLEPVKDLCIMDADFGKLEDERNIDMWRFYVQFFDEMGYATKADVDVIKHTMTARRLTRRPMRSNSTEEIDQNATFIGASNKELSVLINDPTGLRRFVSLRFKDKPDWKAINSADYQSLWECIGFECADPMIPFKEALGALQEADRVLSPVEDWLSSFDPTDDDFALRVKKDGRTISPKDLFRVFSAWEKEMRPGLRPTIEATWAIDMKRLLKDDANDLPFKRSDQRTSSGFPFIYTRASHLKVVN